MPRAATSTALARILLEMREAGTYEELMQHHSLADVARANNIDPQTLRAALSNMNKKANNAKATGEGFNEAEAEAAEKEGSAQ